MKKALLLIELFVLSFFVISCSMGQEKVNVKIYVEGEYSYTLTVNKGSKIDFTLDDEDYIFINWTDEKGEKDYTNEIVNGEMSLYANAVKIGTRFTITYHLNDEASFQGNAGHPSIYYAGEDEIELCAPIRPTKFEFSGWYCNGKLIDKISKDMYGDLDIYDSWIDNNDYCNITYVLDGATSSNGELKDKAIVGGTYDIPYAIKEGYFFNGWYLDSEFTNRVYTLQPETTEDVTLYAKFSEKTKDNTYVSFVGDSISTYHGYIPADAGAYYPTFLDFPAEHTYFLLTCSEMGFHFLKNDSYSGSRLTTPVTSGDTILPPAISDSRIAGLSDGVHDPDILIIHIGTNDYSQGISVDSFRRTITEYCKKIRKLYDDVEIYFCLHPANNYPASYIKIRESFNAAILEESKPENSNYGIIDLTLAWDQSTCGPYIFSNAHPSEAGFRKMADVIIAELKKTHNYD